MKRNIMVNLLVDQPFLFIYAGQYTIIKVEITTLEQYYNTHTHSIINPYMLIYHLILIEKN
jgi:hypothetical protein